MDHRNASERPGGLKVTEIGNTTSSEQVDRSAQSHEHRNTNRALSTQSLDGRNWRGARATSGHRSSG